MSPCSRLPSDPFLRPAGQSNRPGANLQIYDFAALSFRARDGREGKCATPPARSTWGQERFEPFGHPPLPITIKAIPACPIMKDQPMTIAAKIAAVSLAALTMGAVLSTGDQAQARGLGLGLGIGLAAGAVVGAAAASSYPYYGGPAYVVT